jgi:eukaryotic-like serine/threonine-protein kinase
MGTESNPRPPKKDDDVAALLFGPFELDLRSGELKKAGALLHLQPQPFKVLALLTSRAGELVTREEIQAEVWPAGTFVDFEQSLNFCIRQIRSVLGDSALTPHYIETLPRRGYRWIGGPVEKVSAVLEFRRPAAVARLSALPEADAPAPESGPADAPRRAASAWAIGAAVAAALALGWFLGWRGPAPERIASFHRLTYRRGSVDSARFAPDGQVVFSAAWEGEPLAFFASRVETRESRRVEVSGSRVVGVSRQGEVAFLKGNLLARAPLAGGPPKEVLTGVLQADWTPDGSEFVVVRQGQGPAHLEFPIGTVLCEAVRPSHVRLSPDASQVAFLDHPLWNDDRGSVAVVDRKGQKRTLSDGWASVEGLAWSPRGEEVWFTGTRVGADSALHAVGLDGRLRTVLPAMGRLVLHDVSRDGRVLLVRTALRNEIRFRRLDEAEERDLSWLDLSSAEDLSADGRTLLFMETGEGGGPDYTMFLRQTDGALPVRLGSGRAMGLSPDGRWVVSIPLKDRSRIDVVPTGAGETRSLRNPAFREYDMAGWLPVGRTIYFTAADAKGKSRTYLQDLDGGAPRTFLPEGFYISRSTFTPDGRFLACACKPAEPEGEGPGLCLFPVDGGEPRPIAGAPKGAWPVAFDETGRLYLRAPQKGPVAKLSRLDLKTGRLEPWREITVTDRAGATGIQRILVARNGQAYAYWYARNLADLYVVDDAR